MKSTTRRTEDTEQENPVKEITSLADLTPDDRNLNQGTEFGNGLIAKSIEQYGLGRSILTDRNGKIIAGNKTTENAAAIGAVEDIIVVKTDGTQLVVVQRTDLDMDADPAARELAFADNVAAQENFKLDKDMLRGLVADGANFEGFMGKKALRKMMEKGEKKAARMDNSEEEIKPRYDVLVVCKTEEEQVRALELLIENSFSCRAMNT